jgi:YgiT-type zinc finger domain-containing protein
MIYNMKRCFFCKGRIIEEEVRVDFRWGDDLVVIEDVPAEVCQQCGETYFSPEVYKEMENLAKRKEQPIKHIAIDVIRFGRPVMGKVRSL